MKIRNGFVSNSSSSSFIVVFDKKPKTIEETQQMLFGTEKSLFYDYYDDEETGSHNISTEKIAETVFNDLQEQKPMSEKQIIEEILMGNFDGCPDFPHEEWCKATKNITFEKNPDEYRKIDKEFYDKYGKETEKAAKECYKNFMKDVKRDQKIFRFNYSDNKSGYDSALEHGEIFNKLKHLQISQH